MAEVTEYKPTEQDALDEEVREREWQNTWGKNMDRYIQKIDALLAEGTRETRMQLLTMFSDQDFFGHYRQVDEFAIMYVVLSIYQMEDAGGITETILQQADTVAGLMDCMFEFKMILYRLDFSVGQGTEKELLSFLKRHSVSPCWMKVMMTTCVMRPLSMALKLENIFESAGMGDLRFSMLEFLEEYFPGSYRNIAKIASVFHENGQEDMERQYMRRIPLFPEQLQGQETVMLKLQELLWKVRYRETGADGETVLFMREHMVSDAIWNFLMQHCEVTEKEYYLQIANVLFEYEEIQKAEIVLKRSLMDSPGDELTLCLLAELSLRVKDVQTASSYLSHVEFPGELTASLRGVCASLKGRN